MDHRDRTLALSGIGVLLLLAGLLAALLGPAEMYCFYLFEEGGPFAYPGFGFGSFMFGNIAAQILGYYMLAAVLIPLGYGHLRVRRWARPLALAAMWAWLVVGAPLVLVVFVVLLGTKELALAGAIVALIVLALSYLALPWLMIRFYRGRNVRLTFETRDPTLSWVESIPIRVLTLSGLYVFFALMLHIPILFNGLYPLFGRFLTGLEGIVLLDLSILCLAWLTWGTVRRRRWAWWGGLIYWVGMTASWAITFVSYSWSELLDVLQFPARELEFLDGIPAHGARLALLICTPMAITVGVIAASRRCWRDEIPVQKST